jgi:ABC-type glycerol-3-phosphate transport system substrate-binding protein
MPMISPKPESPIKQVGATFTGLYDKLKTDFVAGSGDYDMVIFYPSYIGVFAGNGYLTPLDDFMKPESYQMLAVGLAGRLDLLLSPSVKESVRASRNR